jgi:cephalosporin hydroxylase
MSKRQAASIVADFHRLYYERQAQTWTNTSWLGVQALKCPLDLWVYQELIFRLRPQLVVETGTAAGGSALFVASCMDLVGEGRVLTVDIQEESGRPNHDRITYLLGSSVSKDVFNRVAREAADAATVMVILDSDHRAPHVLEELRLYGPLVTPGSYVIVEDTNVNGNPILPAHGPGPHEAVKTFLSEQPAFARDDECEKFLLTFNPGGYLRRRA